MLFLGLATGLGSALVVGGTVEPMELGHLPFRKATFEDYVGERGRERLGKKKWQKAVLETIERLTAAPAIAAIRTVAATRSTTISAT